MSRENVEAVRQGFEAFAEGGVETFLSLLHPEFELTTPPELAAEPDTYRGAEGMRRYFDSFEEAMEDIRFVPDGEFIDAGDKVVVPVRLVARGRETGIEVEQRLVQVWTMREGKALRLDAYATLEEALQAAGVSE